MLSAIRVCHRALSSTSVWMCCCNRPEAIVILLSSLLDGWQSIILLVGHPAGARVKLDFGFAIVNVSSRRRLALMLEVKPLDRSATWPYHARLAMLTELQKR